MLLPIIINARFYLFRRASRPPYPALQFQTKANLDCLVDARQEKGVHRPQALHEAPSIDCPDLIEKRYRRNGKAGGAIGWDKNVRGR
jgi:hypothetical protein